jgi:hypothetical protein
MGNILQIGFTTEGTTDVRFLQNIIRKSFETVAFECRSAIEVYEPVYLSKVGDTFVEQITNLTTKYNYFHVLCIHRDSDSPTIENTMRNFITPAFQAVLEIKGVVCKNLVPIIPIQMSEAWMMADFDLLKEKIGTDKTNIDLGLPVRISAIENDNNPKETISNSIRIARINQTRRQRRKLNISHLYSPISQELTIDKLIQLPSFMQFIEGIRQAMRKLNYLPK